MSSIKKICARKVLNSHVEFTNEFTIELKDGNTGVGSSSKGETISIYEDKTVSITPEVIIRQIQDDGFTDRDVSQPEFDAYLQSRIQAFGRNNAFSLSLAFFNATRGGVPRRNYSGTRERPKLCLNILNGGWHAYTNPVMSDFSEYMLVARTDNIEEVVAEHNQIQRLVREKQLQLEKELVGGNPVNRFATRDNRECIEFLLSVCENLKIGSKYELMIDASASDLRQKEEYRLAITTGRTYSREKFTEYWGDLIRQYPLAFLEDPFHEGDTESWQQLTIRQDRCRIIGDNFYSSDALRIEQGARQQCTHGVVIKPNQAGTVTAVRQAAQTAKKAGQIGIGSHRSISTEETFIAWLSCEEKIPYIKIGPLFSDYSSILRLNAIIRFTGNHA